MVVVATRLALVVCRAVLWCVPLVPLARVSHVVGEQITLVMAHVVRRAEGIIEGHIDVATVPVFLHHVRIAILGGFLDCQNRFAVNVMFNGMRLQRLIFCGQHHVAGRIVFVVDVTAVLQDVGICHEQFLLRGRQLVPVPIADR